MITVQQVVTILLKANSIRQLLNRGGIVRTYMNLINTHYTELNKYTRISICNNFGNIIIKQRNLLTTLKKQSHVNRHNSVKEISLLFRRWSYLNRHLYKIYA